MPEIQQQRGDKLDPKLEMNFEYTTEPTTTEVYTTDVISSRVSRSFFENRCYKIEIGIREMREK